MTDKKNTGKDVIYVDVEEEITAIIDKVRGSDDKIVALVLPKRASVFQSIVNMKLLKRAAEQANKNVVLITSDAGLLPLAGSVGLHVAKSLSSKPEVPDAPAHGKLPKDVDEAAEELDDEELDKNQTVGQLNGDDDEEETIELDDIDVENPAEDSKAGGRLSLKNKKLRIPNFNKFRLLLLVGGGGLVLLIIFLVLATQVLPKATVTIRTNSQALDISQDVTLKFGEGVAVDVEKSILPVQRQEVQKEVTQEVPATGQKNMGVKATGSVNMKAKNCSTLSTPSPVPAGTGITANGRTYITQEKATFGSGTFDGTCLNFTANNIDIVAQAAGTQSNVADGSFTVLGRSDVTATGSASGGTDNIIVVISQQDIDNAKKKIVEQDTASVKKELVAGLGTKGVRPIEATFATGAAEEKLSANAGDEASVVTVTQKVTYSMLGVADGDIEKLVQNAVKNRIDTSKQSILDYGINAATFTLLMAQPDGAQVNLQATAIAGPQLNVDDIKQQIAGKKANNAEELIKQNPGVTEVTVTYSPFWVSSIPGKTGKITVVVEEPQK